MSQPGPDPAPDPVHDPAHDPAWDPAWEHDSLELLTVGIDVGSSTSHLVLSRLWLQRLTQSLSSKFVVTRRERVYESDITLTPYLSEEQIDTDELWRFFEAAYRDAGVGQAEVDTGAVILTGVALERRNARQIADLFADEGGRFVCAAAGHHLEAAMAAHGSGAVALSNAGELVLNVDIGGGTTKLALAQSGHVLQTAAIAVGSRLVSWDDQGVLARVEQSVAPFATRCGLSLHEGAELARADREKLAAEMADTLLGHIWAGNGAVREDALVTEPGSRPWASASRVTFSGGVSEYLFADRPREVGDLGPDLARAIRARVESGALPSPVTDPGERIRATVIGMAEFTVEASGNTIFLTDPRILPFRNVPVVRPAYELPSADRVAAATREAVGRLTLLEDQSAIAVGLRWEGPPVYGGLRELAQGVADAWRSLDRALVLLVDTDVGRTLGRILVEELAFSAPLIALDGIDVGELDFIDVGELVEPGNIVPVVVKSLMFGAPGAAAGP